MYYLKKATSPLLAIILLCSCSETKTTEETIQISTMDSTSKVLKEQNDKLEEQTKKVETSVEKMEQEFQSNNK
jgi:ABC-type molybdate transport system substrate-binding protein